MDPPNSAALSSRILELLRRQPAGHSMLREFYSDEDIYQLDCQRVWRTGWLFAGHACEIPNPGDYFTLEVDSDSLIVIRNADGRARALHNVCRHRGSMICDGPAGRAKRLVCPYHRWTYDLDGNLLHAPGMQEDLDKAALGLRSIHVRETAGLIFVSLANEPPGFDMAQE